MQVSCGNCGASYEFDASAIPAEGYNAQCTGCGEVFFVTPEAAAPAAAPEPAPVAAPEPAPVAAPEPAPVAAPEPAPVAAPAEPAAAALITVTCSGCGAAYQFAPTDIPAEGYDAQCTQCQSVFFVSPNAAAAPAPAEPAPAEPAPAEPAPVELVPKSEPEPVTLSAPKVEPAPADIPQPAPIAPEPTPGAEPIAAPQPTAGTTPEPATGFAEPAPESDEDHDDLLALHAELGEPDQAPDGASMEDDFETIMRRKRKRLMIIGGILVAIPLLLGFTYLVLPGVWDSTIGPLVGVKARVNPDAIPLMEAGLTVMLNDTDASYDQAIKKFEAALAVDALYPEALAFAGLAHLFKGKDIHARGLEVRAKAQKVVAEITTINAEKKRQKDAAKRVAELRAQAKTLTSEASKLNEQGSDEFAKGWDHLTKGLEHFQSKSAIVVGVSGIFLLGRDKDRINDAKQRLEVSLDIYGAGKQVDLKNPPDPWLPYLEAMVRLATRNPNDDVEAIDYYQAALKKEPRFQRARFDMASMLEITGKNDKAIAAAEKIIAEVPEHQKAKDFIGRVKQNGATPAPDEAAPAGKKKKKKKRR